MDVRSYYVYKFDELPEEGQRLAIEKHSDINVNHDWWDSVYEDAAMIGLKLDSFDIYRRTITGELTLKPWQVIRRILKNHGDTCETYKTAAFWKDRLNIKGQRNTNSCEFFRSLLHDYLNMLDLEYNYLTGEEEIKETIRANDYDFKANGEID